MKTTQQLSRSELPEIKQKLLEKQKGLCAICKRDLTNEDSFQICLDHNHETWMVRAVLCRPCNALEGKYYRAFIRVGAKNKGMDYTEFLKGLVKFTKIKDTKYRYPDKPKRRKK